MKVCDICHNSTEQKISTSKHVVTIDPNTQVFDLCDSCNEQLRVFLGGDFSIVPRVTRSASSVINPIRINGNGCGRVATKPKGRPKGSKNKIKTA